MNTADIRQRYDELYELMAGSGDPKKMKVFGDAERWAFDQMLQMNPRMAEQWAKKLEPVDWNNYLSPEEAESIVMKMQGQDGHEGATWNTQQVESAVRSLGGDTELMPYYNSHALYVAMNMIASDHMNTLKEFVTSTDIPKVVYKMAVEKLKDVDRPEFIRTYYNL